MVRPNIDMVKYINLYKRIYENHYYLSELKEYELQDLINYLKWDIKKIWDRAAEIATANPDYPYPDSKNMVSYWAYRKGVGDSTLKSKEAILEKLINMLLNKTINHDKRNPMESKNDNAICNLCHSKFIKDIDELCDSCSIIKHVEDGIRDKIIPQIENRKIFLTVNKFNEYLEAEIEEGIASMDKLYDEELKGDEPRRRWLRVRDYIWNKEKIKALKSYQKIPHLNKLNYKEYSAVSIGSMLYFQKQQNELPQFIVDEVKISNAEIFRRMKNKCRTEITPESISTSFYRTAHKKTFDSNTYDSILELLKDCPKSIDSFKEKIKRIEK